MWAADKRPLHFLAYTLYLLGEHPPSWRTFPLATAGLRAASHDGHPFPPAGGGRRQA